MIIVFKEKCEDIVIDLKNKFKSITIEEILEIKCIILKNENNVMYNEVIKYIYSKFNNIIETINECNIVSYIDSIIKCNDFKFESNELKKSRDNTIIKSSIEYTKLTWDVDLVTGRGKSYEIEEGDHFTKVAIIDSGIDLNHPDLKNNIISCKIFTPNDNTIKDFTGHGTMIAGIIAANGNIKGIAPNIGLAIYKVFDCYNNCESEWLIKAIIEAANDGVDVINLSLSMYKSLLKEDEKNTILAFKRTISYARSKGCIIVASAGSEKKGYNISNVIELASNRGYNSDIQIHIPGGLEGIITVSAVDRDGVFCDLSNYGNNIDICSPTGSLRYMQDDNKLINISYAAITTYPTYLSNNNTCEKGYIINFGGTSLATPKVSATIALIISRYNKKFGIKPIQCDVEKFLYEGSIKNKNIPNMYFGYGCVNAENSLKLI